MKKLVEESLDIIKLAVAVLLLMAILSLGLYLIDETLANYFLTYIFPACFIILFISIFNDSYKES